ncbi:DUF2000 domain-containing protein [Mucilaginibacter rubeus]|uniref:DUF2000 domain-containing protein n=1 Tax=Mucilaginibacter rubeus TaxID=2027860 RepID=A0A5C1I8T9_9SPHI|nr:DUF2000 domain-containing protein [Mucilaginibacter rubeus]QEM14008.1 DUF2000 domain-containing protein [Mucilaginibacter rubeus]
MNQVKIAIVIKDQLATWQKLNVTAFLASSVAIAHPDTHGAELITASGNNYMPFMKYPVLVYKADTGAQLQRAFNRAKERGLHIGIYTQGLFATKTETDNLSEIASHTDADLDLVGIVVYGESKKVDKALDGLRLHD